MRKNSTFSKCEKNQKSQELLRLKRAGFRYGIDFLLLGGLSGNEPQPAFRLISSGHTFSLFEISGFGQKHKRDPAYEI